MLAPTSTMTGPCAAAMALSGPSNSARAAAPPVRLISPRSARTGKKLTRSSSSTRRAVGLDLDEVGGRQALGERAHQHSSCRSRPCPGRRGGCGAWENLLQDFFRS
nr:hypothetical protein [Methylobacterium radiotolerans JCM 2831]